MIAVLHLRGNVLIESRQTQATNIESLGHEEARILASKIIAAAYEASKYREPVAEKPIAEKLIELEKQIGLLRKEQEKLLGFPPPIVEAADADAVRMAVYGQPGPMVPRYDTSDALEYPYSPSKIRHQDGFHSAEK